MTAAARADAPEQTIWIAERHGRSDLGCTLGDGCGATPTFVHAFTRGRDGLYRYNGDSRCKKHRSER